MSSDPVEVQARTLWIGEIDDWMDEQFIESRLLYYEIPVKSVKVIRNRMKGISLGYGFIEFYSHAQASQVLEELKEITELTEDDTEIFNRFYVGLILEFTDLVLDTDDILFMINDGTLVSRMLLQEFNDMLYEIQYEIAMEQLQVTRNLAIAMIQQSALDEMKYAQEKIEKTKERRDKHTVAMAKRKVNKRIIDKKVMPKRGRRK